MTETQQERKIVYKDDEIISQIKSEKTQRNVPATNLDLQMLTTEPGWQNLNPDLQAKLIKIIEETAEQTIIDKLHGILAVYTKDIRLGNLSTASGEYEFVAYYLELAVDLLDSGFSEPCILALNKALSHLELSSSKSGFLRKNFNTYREEKLSNQIDPPKKSPLGGKKQD